ncbi:MAG TPA: cytochrome c, partial [Gaiellaceae bacterium]|nr:cytochrome c [Gaiellaceae bacterium]
APKESGGQIDGAEVFAQAGCGTCHALAAAGASGAVGPNLDEAQPSEDDARQVVTEGRGAMPSFADQLSPEQIAAVARYVSQSAGR